MSFNRYAKYTITQVIEMIIRSTKVKVLVFNKMIQYVKYNKPYIETNANFKALGFSK